MKELVIYQSEDGNRYDDIAAAEAADSLHHSVEAVMLPLAIQVADTCGFANGGGYFQHHPNAVRGVKRGLIDLTRPHLEEWFRTQEDVHGKNMMDIHPSWFGRMLDGGCPALEKAWSRMCRIITDTSIDLNGREYGQQYYTMHPETAKDICLNPAAS